MDRVLQLEKRPTLICGAYQLCIAILKAMKHSGLNCPDDLSIISHCDSEACMATEPELTAISPDNYKRGFFAATALLIHFGEDISLAGKHCGNLIAERQSVKNLSV